MRTVLILAGGIWIGQKICATLADNRAREREVKIRKQLEKFMKENLPNLQPAEVQKEVKSIMK